MQVSAPTNVRKYRRGEESKQKILEATISLLEQYDLKALSLDRIAKEAGIAKSSVLWHFGSKEMLVADAIHQVFQEIESSVHDMQLGHLPVLKRLEAMLDHIVTLIEKRPKLKGIILGLVFSSDLSDPVREKIFVTWQSHRQEIIRTLSDDTFTVTDEMASALLGMIHGCYIQWAIGEFKQPLRPIVQSVTQLLRTLRNL
ncbi:TetR/AcrR family transcriptional regulator [Parendozoicomonas sp. Alg238-R29]|uniref:TetR/AcrR family transcriptional regulator n=1 Tax=Parendozoicomonas sp. Alg238-R29 TaxID=2993446 RepID=UPI00248D4901|nr:TetR/AcrR family transcriptional regulator [Parendozoicomonas sp. Alg238-R29]